MRLAILILTGAAVPTQALAHAAERGLIMLLPTGYYLTGGALAVGVTFLALGLFKARSISAYARAEWSVPISVPMIGHVTRWAAFLVFWLLIYVGLTGSRDPLINPLPLAIWTVWWIGFTAFVALFGDLWSWVNPWSGPVRLFRRLLGPSVRLPIWIGYWPAILGLGAVAWFEIVSIAPDDPARLARAAAVYWLVQFAAMCVFGEDAWRQRGEAFSVFFALIGRVGPIGNTGAGLVIRWPGAGLTRTGALPLSGWLFAVAAIATVTFDGLSATFWWLGLIGVNPLEFPGRSAVFSENTAGLVGVWLALALSFALAVWSGLRLAKSQVAFTSAIGRFAYSLLPIAVAYHVAHYLPVLLVNGQYAMIAVSDPFGSGADWLGLGAWPVTTSFLTDFEQVETIWQVQTGVIVTGHLLAVLVAHAIAMELESEPRRALLGQLPLAALMVGYTVLGLWLLSSPTGA